MTATIIDAAQAIVDHAAEATRPMNTVRPTLRPGDRVYLNGECGTVERDVYDAENDYTLVLFDDHDCSVLRNPRQLQRSNHQMETLVKEARAAASRACGDRPGRRTGNVDRVVAMAKGDPATTTYRITMDITGETSADIEWPKGQPPPTAEEAWGMVNDSPVDSEVIKELDGQMAWEYGDVTDVSEAQ